MKMNAGEHFHQDGRIEVLSICQQDIEPHSHPFLEMVYITSGRALHTLNGVETVVRRGDYFIIDYDAVHQYALIDSRPFNLINILMQPELIDKTLKNCRSFQEVVSHYLIRFPYASLEQNPAGVIFHDEDGSILTLFRRTESEYTGKNPGYIELIRCHIIEIIVRTMRTISKRDGAHDPHDISAFIRRYVDENYMQPITLSAIGRELNYSLSYLCRRFKQDTGFTFVTYVQQKRMEQSARLLANTDKHVDEIAGLVGYQDVKFFHSVFKNFWRMTPTAFRKAHGA